MAATSGATYTLQEQINGGGWSTIQSGAATSKAESGKAGGTYGYRLQVCNGDCSDWSAPTTVGVTPAKPTVTIPSGDQKAAYTISWTQPSSTTSFLVQEQVNGGSWTTVYSGGGTSNVITGLTGTFYSLYAGVTINEPTTAGDEHAVRSCNPYACSAWVVAPVRAIVTKQPYLSVPGGSISGSYTVGWGAVPYATSYTLQQQTNGGGWGTVYSGGGTSKAFSGKGNGTYGYRVEACNTAGCSGWSNTGSVTVFILGRVSGLTSSVVWTEMTAASGYVASPLSSPTEMQPDMKKPPPQGTYDWILHARWNAVSGATYYNVKYDQPAGHPMTTYIYIPGLTIGSDSLYPPDKRIMTSSTGITVYAQACDASGCSAWVGPVTPTVN